MRRILLALCLGLWLLSTGAARADGDEIFIIHKQRVKETGRWSLEDWLVQRDRMRLMDLWLHLHSPSPFEFYFGGDYDWGPIRTGQWHSGWRGYFAAYATIFGIQLERNFSPEPSSWTGIFNLRIFGLHAQGTNITLQGGARNVQGAASSWNPLAGVSLTLYLRRFFGLEGNYRHHFASTVLSTGVPLESDRFEGGGFIDFSFVRVYADYFHEAGGTYQLGGFTQSGGQIGARIYF